MKPTGAAGRTIAVQLQVEEIVEQRRAGPNSDAVSAGVARGRAGRHLELAAIVEGVGRRRPRSARMGQSRSSALCRDDTGR
jgi:hypothetical protein